MDSTPVSWIGDIICALQNTRGEADLRQIYRWIELHRPSLPPEWKAAVRSAIQRHSSDTRSYKPGDPDLFVHKDRGRCALRNPQDAHRYLEMNWKDVERIAQTLPPEHREAFLESVRNG
jgi:hypothetical protein